MRALLFVALVACQKRDHDDSLDEILRPIAEQGPGAQIVVEYRGERIFEGNYGYADLENDVPVTSDTVFGIGSISKQFGAAAIMQLVEAGKLTVDDPLSKWFPKFPRAERITIRDLLRHTSGIEDMEYTGPWPATMAVKRTDDEIVAMFADRPPRFEPNQSWSYSTSNYILLGMIVSKVSGVPLADYLRDRVFAPAGLEHTQFCEPYELIPHRARPYEPKKTGGGFAPARMSIITQYGIGGGLCSTARDLIAWQKALESGRVVSPASYREMITPQPLADGTPIHYGYGLCSTTLDAHRLIGHDGNVPGYSASLFESVDDDFRVASTVNGGPIPAWAAAKETLGIPDAVAVPITPAELAKYALKGYLLPGTVGFEIDGDHLMAHFVTDTGNEWSSDQRFPLVYVGDDTFEAPDGFGTFHFTFGRRVVVQVRAGADGLTILDLKP